MENTSDLTAVGMQSLVSLGNSLMSALPNILGALLLLILGLLLARVVSFLVRKGLQAARFDRLSDKLKLGELFSASDIETAPSKWVARFVYWVIVLVFIITASDTLGWSIVSESISGLLAYLPRLFSAIIVFVVGFYIATFVRKALRGILESLSVSSARMLSGFAFYLIVVILSVTALDQAGVDTAIVTSNVAIIVGGIFLAFAISFGIGSRDILTNILSSFYSKNNFHVGQDIEMNEVKGRIEKIDITSCTVKTKDGKITVPVKRLITETVKIK